MENLLTLVEEATRSSEHGIEFFVEPAEGALRRAMSRRHHIVFGRRGSGKSSLLRKVGKDLMLERRPMAFVDLEPFKGHSYPDLLISVLLTTFGEFLRWLATAATAPSNWTKVWRKVVGGEPTRPPLDRKSCEALRTRLKKFTGELERLLHSADDATVSATSGSAMRAKVTRGDDVGAEVSVPPLRLSAGAKEGEERESTVNRSETTSFTRSKEEYLRRKVIEFRDVFRDMAILSDGDSYILLDDLYQLRRAEQPRILDYLHSIAKDNRLWLKVGTIKHRSNWYLHTSPPLGLKLGDDADDIDLDVTLEKYSIAKTFLREILQNLSRSVGLPMTCGYRRIRGLIDWCFQRGARAGLPGDLSPISYGGASRGAWIQRGGKVGAGMNASQRGLREPTKREELERDVLQGGRIYALTQYSFRCGILPSVANCNCFRWTGEGA
ncbi:MAG: ATP-binding protein [Phycisphaerales bacterium]|nr:ATP-binding protein [Phycisphaerales bacterium]